MLYFGALCALFLCFFFESLTKITNQNACSVRYAFLSTYMDHLDVVLFHRTRSTSYAHVHKNTSLVLLKSSLYSCCHQLDTVYSLQFCSILSNINMKLSYFFGKYVYKVIALLTRHIQEALLPLEMDSKW